MRVDCVQGLCRITAATELATCQALVMYQRSDEALSARRNLHGFKMWGRPLILLPGTLRAQAGHAHSASPRRQDKLNNNRCARVATFPVVPCQYLSRLAGRLPAAATGIVCETLPIRRLAGRAPSTHCKLSPESPSPDPPRSSQRRRWRQRCWLQASGGVAAGGSGRRRPRETPRASPRRRRLAGWCVRGGSTRQDSGLWK